MMTWLKAIPAKAWAVIAAVGAVIGWYILQRHRVDVERAGLLARADNLKKELDVELTKHAEALDKAAQASTDDAQAHHQAAQVAFDRMVVLHKEHEAAHAEIKTLDERIAAMNARRSR